MKLKEWLRNYRQVNGLSMRELAAACNVTAAYISALEKGVNPKTGKPYSVSLSVVKKIAAGTGYTVQELVTAVDDMNFPPETDELNDDEGTVIDSYRQLNLDNRRMLKSLMATFLAAQSSMKEQTL